MPPRRAGTVNYAIDFLRDSGVKIADNEGGFVEDGLAESSADRSIYTSRVVRTDFCFIVLALALVDALWILLPTGAQAYWMLQFVKGFRRHHV